MKSGFAFTAKGLGTIGNILEAVGPGDVVVQAAGGRYDFSVWGPQMTFSVKRQGGKGVLIDGVIECTKTLALCIIEWFG